MEAGLGREWMSQGVDETTGFQGNCSLPSDVGELLMKDTKIKEIFSF